MLDIVKAGRNGLDDKEGPKAIIGAGDRNPDRVRKMVTFKPDDQGPKADTDQT